MLDRKEQLRREYVARINRVMDYIGANLDGDLSLARLAREASFSPFHFHRVFRAMVGETIGDFIRRLRIEKAAMLLANYPARAVTGIALDCGFSGSAAFARAFRERFGMSASAWRRSKAGKPDRKHGKAERNGRKDLNPPGRYTAPVSDATERSNTMVMKVEVRKLPELHVAYVRNIGPYNTIGKAFGRLCEWAGPRGLLDSPDAMMLGIYHDDPEVTETDKLRSDACVTLPPGTEVEGDVGAMKVPGGLFAVGHCEIRPDQFGEAWNYLMGEWMPGSGYEPDDRLCYEVYLNDHATHPEGKFILDICEPVRPMR